VTYRYLMKSDEDSYIVLRNFSQWVRDLPKNWTYAGIHLTYYGQHYMQGRGYLMSMDLTQYIMAHPYALKHSWGPEDMITATWVENASNLTGRNVTWASSRHIQQYGKHEYDAKWTPPVGNETLLIHGCKQPERWFKIHRDVQKIRKGVPIVQPDRNSIE
ncbi:hypothetical protein PROFUN_16950, partial [Planoprotostelium fungivorum]